MLSIIGIVLAWLLCGFLAMGKIYAYFQRKYPRLARKNRRGDRIMAVAWLLFGPCSLIVAMINGEGGKYGWLAPWRREEQDEPNA